MFPVIDVTGNVIAFGGRVLDDSQPKYKNSSDTPVFKKSKKSESGALESRAGFKGLCRKCLALLFVLVAYRLDLALGINYVRNAVIIGFITNELISLVENAGLMGLQLPPVITKAIDILKGQSQKAQPIEANQEVKK